MQLQCRYKYLYYILGEMRKDLKNAVTQSNAKFAKLELEVPKVNFFCRRLVI